MPDLSRGGGTQLLPNALAEAKAPFLPPSAASFIATRRGDGEGDTLVDTDLEPPAPSRDQSRRHGMLKPGRRFPVPIAQGHAAASPSPEARDESAPVGSPSWA